MYGTTFYKDVYFDTDELSLNHHELQKFEKEEDDIVVYVHNDSDDDAMRFSSCTGLTAQDETEQQPKVQVEERIAILHTELYI